MHLARVGPPATLAPRRSPVSASIAPHRAVPRRRRPAAAAAKGKGGVGGGWLGGLSNWPNKANGNDDDEDDDDDGSSMRPINEVLGDGSRSTGSQDDDDDGADSPPPAPLACLVVGLSPEELERLRAAMHAIDADIVRLIPCPRALLEAPGVTLEHAVSLPHCPAPEPPPEGLPGCVVFLSGMSGPEVAEMVACYRGTEPALPSAAFCALVPGNRGRTVRELVGSVWRDERRARERRR